jgi:hypothetical protein
MIIMFEAHQYQSVRLNGAGQWAIYATKATGKEFIRAHTPELSSNGATDLQRALEDDRLRDEAQA